MRANRGEYVCNATQFRVSESHRYCTFCRPMSQSTTGVDSEKHTIKINGNLRPMLSYFRDIHDKTNEVKDLT